MIKKSIALLIFCFYAHAASPQDLTGILEGTVLSVKPQTALQNANVVLVELNLGDATDTNGNFRIEKIPPGKYELAVSLIGYKTYLQEIQFQPGQTLNVTVELEATVLEGSEITVEGQRAEDIRFEITPPTFKVTPQKVEWMPGALEDVMRTVVNLPGVQATSDFSNQFIVRGGGPNQNLILLDNVEIYNPYRNSGMPSLINPVIVQDVYLYAGGYPALFGDRLSAVLIINTREGISDKWLGGRVGVNLANANAVLEGKTPFWNGSWLVSSRRTYNQFFAQNFAKRLTLNNVALPTFEDWHGKVVFRPSPKHRIQLHGLFGRNNQDWLIKDELGEQDSERERFDGSDRLKNTVFGAAWNLIPSEKFQARLYGNWYKNQGNSDFAGDFIPANTRGAIPISSPDPTPPVFAAGDSTFLFDYSQKFSFRKISLGGWLVYELRNHIFETGAGVDFLNNSVGSELGLSDFGEVVFNAFRGAPNWFGALGDSTKHRDSHKRFFAYIQNKWTPFSKLTVQPGLRFDRYEFIDRSYFSPRLSLTYDLNPATKLTTAWGIYRQSPGFEKLLDAGQIFDLLKFGDLQGLAAERAMHIVVGLHRDLGDPWQLSIEAYHKKFDDLIDQASGFVTRPVAVYVAGAPGVAESYLVQDRLVFAKITGTANNVQGTAHGLDVRIEKRIQGAGNRWFGWLSYSFGKSTRKQTLDGTETSLPYDFDRRHTLNFVLNYRLGRKFNMGVTWRYGSGFPYTQAIRVEPLVAAIAPDPANPDSIVDAVLTDPENGFVRFIPTFGGPENINSSRFPDYHRLDARITYSTQLFDSSWQFYLDFINVYNRKNVLFYRNIIRIEGADEHIPLALRFPKPALFREPVYMYLFIPSFGLSVAF